jgi:hypothetical protein
VSSKRAAGGFGDDDADIDSGSISPHRKNLYASLYPDIEAISKEPGDGFLKGYPAVLAP